MIKVAQLILSLSILVFIHELGHFLFAKLFKTRVEKFYLFFNPWFSIFKFKKGDTEYGLGWLPLGGYVKIAGMIDESMDKEQMKQPPQPWEFRSKPSWQRLLIMLGGVLMNFILAFVIYIAILFTWGETYLPTKEVNKYGIAVDSVGKELGFKDGDKIVMVNDKQIESFDEVLKEVILTSPHKITINRNGKDTSVIINSEDIAKIIKSESLFEPRIPFIIEGFAEQSPAKNAGFEVGDLIIGISDKDVMYYNECKDLLAQNKGKNTEFRVLRNNDTVVLNLTIPETGLIGVSLDLFKTSTQEYTLAQAVPAGVKKTFSEVGSYLKQLKLVFTPKTKAYKSVGSFISITKLFPAKWNWRVFWTMTALLSVMLGVVNILPIPALDGGHVMFTLYEIIIGKKPSDKFLERAQIVGMVILLALIVLALGNDFIRHVF